MVNLQEYLGQTHYGDIETKGFWENVNTLEDVWCLCSITEDDQVLLFHDFPEFNNVVVWDSVDEKEYTIPPRVGTLIEGFRYWYKIGASGGKLSVHNCKTFDKPIIEKMVPKCLIPENVWRDTYIQSKIQWFNRPCPKGAKSAHGLKAFGIKFGVRKPDIDDWKTMDAYKLHRVVEDCRIQKRTQIFLDEEASKLKEKLGISFDECSVIENLYATACWEQELHGALVDKDHIDSCIKFLDDETKNLAKEIEPHLPKTLKIKSPKVGRKVMTKVLLGKDVPEEIVDGEVVKRWYKPHVNFYNDASYTVYKGFHMSYGDSPSFKKLKDFREWVKTKHVDTKFKEWDYQKETVKGEVLDRHTCSHFLVEPEDMDIIVGAHTRIAWFDTNMSQHDKVKAYLISQGIKWAEEWNFKKDANKQFLRAEKDMIVRYPLKAHPDNQITYEVKKGEPIVSSPKFGEKEYAQLGEDASIGQAIAKFNTYMHRRRFLSNPKDPEEKGVMAYIREDGRVPCGLGNFMTATGRSNQRVIVNLPSEKALFGKEMRSVIIAPKGRVLVGADQKSSQLSIAAFISNNSEYYEAVASGEQFHKEGDGSDTYVGQSAHCHNARNFGLVTQEEFRRAVETQEPSLIKHVGMQRDKYAKGAAFATIFGCSGKKLGLILDVSAKEGNTKRKKYLKEMGLDAVIAYVEKCSMKYPYGGGFYIPVFKGYWLWCKSPHVGVNYFCQGIESIVQKLAILRLNGNLKIKGINAAVVLQVHDECLIECDEEDGVDVGTMACEAYTWAGEELSKWYLENSWAFPAGGLPKVVPDFAGGYAIGKSYYECH